MQQIFLPMNAFIKFSYEKKIPSKIVQTFQIFLDILTKAKACITHSSAILTLTDTEVVRFG